MRPNMTNHAPRSMRGVEIIEGRENVGGYRKGQTDVIDPSAEEWGF